MDRRLISTGQLAEKIRAIEGRYTLGAASSRNFIDGGGPHPGPLPRGEGDLIPTGWDGIDEALGGGLSSGLHEWFSGEEKVWAPPLCILVHLAWRATECARAARWVVWVGRTCHPYARVLVRGTRDRGPGTREVSVAQANRRLLNHSLFVAPRDGAARLWAIDLALRSEAVGLVIADGSGFDKAATQRLQLLARSMEKWVLAARPGRERSLLSAAQTRWVIRAVEQVNRRPGEGRATSILPRWSVELLRCKGLRPVGDLKWLLEWNRAEGAVHLSAPLAGVAGAAEVSKRPRQQRTA